MHRVVRCAGGALATMGLMTMLVGCSSTSPALTDREVSSFSAILLKDLDARPKPTSGLLTVDAAVQRAVRLNANLRTKELEADLAEAKVRAQAGALLPDLIATSDYFNRDRPSLSRSSLSSIYSTGSDQSALSRDIALSWNILDFGLSYVRSEQASDRAGQQQEEVRRVKARIAEETQGNYWRAVAFQQLAPALQALDREYDAAMRSAQRAAKDSQIDPLVAINYQRDILTLRRELNQLQAGLAGVTEQLRQSVGAHADDPLRLVTKVDATSRTSAPALAQDDVARALRQRPEIRQLIYDMRITQAEVDATILQLLPGITFRTAASSDSNSFLLNADWISWGVRVSGNLINVLRLSDDLDVVDAQQDVNRQNALATAAAISMQVYVARARLAIQRQASRDADRFAVVQRQLLRQVRASVDTGVVGSQALVREKLATLLADSRSLIAFADLAAAQAAYATATGDEPFASGDRVGPPSRLVAANAAESIH